MQLLMLGMELLRLGFGDEFNPVEVSGLFEEVLQLHKMKLEFFHGGIRLRLVML